jgi:hypothetical protein
MEGDIWKYSNTKTQLIDIVPLRKNNEDAVKMETLKK